MNKIIRPATKADINAVLRLVHDFYFEYNEYDDVPYSNQTALDTVWNVVDSGLCAVAEVDGEIVGVIGALPYPHLWNTQHLCASEVFFWIDKYHRKDNLGRDLIEMIEHQSRLACVNYLALSCLETHRPEAVSRLYKQAGYKPAERTLIKRLI